LVALATCHAIDYVGVQVPVFERFARRDAVRCIAMFEIEEAISIGRPAAEAWAMLIDFPNVPAWEDGVIEVRQISSGSASIGTTLVARRAYGPWTTNVDCRIVDWQDGRSVTMEILGGPTRRATSRYAVEPVGDDACRVTYSGSGEMRPLLVWLSPIIPSAGRRLVRSNLVRLKQRLEAPATA
jgi:carbon monoxide dehydrogenase subunit G